MKTLRTGQQGMIALMYLWIAGGIAVAFIGLGYNRGNGRY